MTQRLVPRYLALLCVVCLGLTSCQTIHQFLSPAQDWQSRHGQLLYRGKRTTLIGEVLVRFSKAGDMELTFTKGPGHRSLARAAECNFRAPQRSARAGDLVRPGRAGARPDCADGCNCANC